MRRARCHRASGKRSRFLSFCPATLAALVQIPADGAAPTIAFDREQMGFGEAVQYYEFTLNLITDAEKGTLQMGEGGASL